MKAKWTPAMERKLARLYPTHTARECADVLGVSLSAINNRVPKLGLSKSPEWIAECTRQRWADGRHENSRRAHFRKGQEAWNKGIPGSTGNHPNSRRTHFKKGRPAREARNYQPIGTMRITKDGLLERKVTDDPSIYPARRWVSVSRLVWEAANGPVPSGHAVIFRTGRATTDPDKITTDALELVSRAELMRRNSRHTRYPPEVNALMQIRGALNRKINNRSKQA